MAWSAPLTAVAGAGLSAAQWNASVRDNLNESAPALATTAGGYFVATGTNAIAQRLPAVDIVDTSTESTASTSYTDLTTFGPSVTVECGPMALVGLSCWIDNDGTTSASYASWEISGDHTQAVSDDWSLQRDGVTAVNGIRIGVTHLHTGLTAGTLTFTAKYKAGSGTASFLRRELWVLPL
ncbi:hypothetical protein AB0I72_19140 [Nocardiopsis sp. NPDC049922]|uniref:hypothetical protein n=1 Tax=Nocardiopsis sp. NPDC049922 TaxID=3155157 RepID=UPI0033EBD8BD